MIINEAAQVSSVKPGDPEKATASDRLKCRLLRHHKFAYLTELTTSDIWSVTVLLLMEGTATTETHCMPGEWANKLLSATLEYSVNPCPWFFWNWYSIWHYCYRILTYGESFRRVWLMPFSQLRMDQLTVYLCSVVMTQHTCCTDWWLFA